MESRFCGASEIVKGNSRMFETRDPGITDAFNSAIEGTVFSLEYSAKVYFVNTDFADIPCRFNHQPLPISKGDEFADMSEGSGKYANDPSGFSVIATLFA